MTPDEISSRIQALELKVEERDDAFREANKVREEVMKLRKTMFDVVNALALLPGGYQRNIAGGSQSQAAQIDTALQNAIWALK
jgi:hypothetical protein